MKIVVDDLAKQSLIDIYYYNYQYSLKNAIETNKKILLRIHDLEASPYIGRYIPEMPDKHYRERIYGNYRIIYFISEKHNTIFIRYIISGKQNSYLFFEVHKKELFEFFNQLSN